MTVAVGFFDGVHLGHRAILSGADVALTFRNHPLSVVAPERAPRLLMDFDSRVASIKACGVGEVRAFDFTPEFAALSPGEFLSVAGIDSSTCVRCGANWRFGRGGAGDAVFLRERGIEVVVAPYVFHCGERVSSTRIRAALERGEIEDANAMLGRAFSVSGDRVSGKGEGTRLGCPTLNLVPVSLNVRLPLGVYAVEVGGSRAVANYGLAPTFGDRAWESPVIELHFLGQMPEAQDGSRAEVRLLRFLRPERKFGSVGELKAQIARDCEEASRRQVGV